MSRRFKAKQKFYENVDILPAKQAWTVNKQGKARLNKSRYKFVGKIEKDTPGVILEAYSTDKNVKTKRKYYDDFSSMTEKLKSKVVKYLYEKSLDNKGKPLKNTRQKVYLIEK